MVFLRPICVQGLLIGKTKVMTFGRIMSDDHDAFAIKRRFMEGQFSYHPSQLCTCLPIYG